MITVDQHIEIISAGSRLVYQFCVVLAALIGGWVIRYDARHWQFSSYQHWTIMIVALLGALIGSALPGFAAGGFVGQVAWEMPVTPKTVIGGLLFSFVFVALYKKFTKSPLDTSDAFARGAIIMMAIGRIGCIFQHCCYGKQASWGWDLGDGVNRIPVQFIEMVGLFLIVLFIHKLHQKELFTGRRLFIVFMAYGVLRFGMEFLREPIADQFAGLGFYHWLALSVGIIGAYQFLKRSPDRLRLRTEQI